MAKANNAVQRTAKDVVVNVTFTTNLETAIEMPFLFLGNVLSFSLESAFKNRVGNEIFAHKRFGAAPYDTLQCTEGEVSLKQLLRKGNGLDTFFPSPKVGERAKFLADAVMRPQGLTLKIIGCKTRPIGGGTQNCWVFEVVE